MDFHATEAGGADFGVVRVEPAEFGGTVRVRWFEQVVRGAGVALQADQVGVLAVAGDERVVATLLDDPAAFENEDAVGFAERGEAMSDRDRGATLREGTERLLNRLFAFGVDVARGFVEHQDRRIVENRAGDRHALAFAAGEAGAAFAEPGVVAECGIEDEVVGLGGFGGGDRLLGRAFGHAVDEVLPNRAAEQERLLEDATDVATKVVRREAADVDAVDEDAAFADVVESAEQIDERGFAAAALADDADGFAGADFEVDIAEDGLVTFVAEGDVFEADGAVGGMCR